MIAFPGICKEDAKSSLKLDTAHAKRYPSKYGGLFCMSYNAKEGNEVILISRLLFSLGCFIRRMAPVNIKVSQ